MPEKISVIMTSYNYSQYIKEAIESVINQTYTNWELIIVDDFSTDNSREIITEYAKADKRIKPVFHNKNLGLAQAIQTGLKNSNTDWVAFLESDDLFMPNALEEKEKAIATGAELIFTDIDAFQDKERIKMLEDYYKSLQNSSIILDKSKFIENFAKIIPDINIITTFSSVMVKRNLLLNCNFNSFYKPSLDHYLWSQLADCKVFYIDKKLTRWRLHPNSYITKDYSSWLSKYLFCISLYYNTIKNRNSFIKPLLLLNYIRIKLFYVKLSRNSIKINLFNNSFIFEKKFL